jgi:hypothetical protein
MKKEAFIYLVDDKPQVEFEDGTIIDHRSIGYMAIPYSPNSNDYILEPMTASDIDFIIVNDLDIEVEMIDEFTAPDEYADVGLFDGERKPKLHKGKIIIHIK